MFLTVFGQKGGVAKTCTSIHLACVWAQQDLSVCVVDADRNRSATAYAARGMLPFEVVPVEARSVELTVELSLILRQMDTMHAALLVKVDSRKQRLAQEARQILEGFDVDVMQAEIPLLAAFEKAEVEGVCVSNAVDDRGRADLRRMGGWAAYCQAAVQIRDRLSAATPDAISA